MYVAIGATGLKNLKINVPSMVRSGDAVSLSCLYDLEGPLYTIKWYINEKEFYRYVPKADPRQNSYPEYGMKIDMSNSDEHDVTLLNVSRELSGIYKCEVSEDMPTYHTAMKEQRMDIADVPEFDPIIEVEKQRIAADEILKANCTSGASYPATNVTWILNGDPLNNATMQFKIRSDNIPRGRMLMTWSELELKASSSFFHDGRLHLRCFAKITSVYAAAVEFEITEDAPLLAPITGDASPHWSKTKLKLGESSTTELMMNDRFTRDIMYVKSFSHW
ncbi:hypothetical protein PV327_001264 [Microctonus hyperodae]|uniref:Ig-like domain-containing protein n=1 Tax=Microctonus hyperodae TaxID=165561 RepID=A0AA39G8U7_MICHY|nr:hypothetical protein PV327_001264 [Microctonus hyperodae]